MHEHYNPEYIEKKQQTKWQAKKLFAAKRNSTLPKFYCLSMFAYPSGKLHMGHVRNYTIGDVLARFHHFNQFNVLQPFGWDAFGLPAENAAIGSGTPPAQWTYANIEYMRNQLQSLGLAIDWEKEFATCSKDYYKWQQWLFVQLYKKGIIYRKNGLVNWDPVDNTVLANEQVIDGKGWRSGAIVEKKEIPMYYLKITAYAEELLQGLDNLPEWPSQVKTMQKNWIGKSVGLEVKFPLEKSDDYVEVYTTRPDTLCGVSYIAIASDHPLTSLALKQNPQLIEHIKEYKQGKLSEAQFATQEKCGVFTGLYAKNPINEQLVPIWITNYVLSDYGSGAVMGVPAHDNRDYEFARKYNLPITVVITPTTDEAPLPHIEKGILINSLQFNGLDFDQAFTQINNFLKAKNLGQIKTNYRLRDWGISRQRYWGCPIPIIHCQNCGDVLVPEENLPVVLPEDVVPDGLSSPLSTLPEFYNKQCPQCGAEAKAETDTMDTFVDSSWYYARFACSNNNEVMLDERADYWVPVDQYIGGIEHAILHLLYARFIHKCLRDLALVNSDEPFAKLLTQGMVLAKTYYRQATDGRKTWFNPSDVEITTIDKTSHAIFKGDNQEVIIGELEKMSKSKNNGVDPQTIIKEYGADTARLFMMFAAPPEQSLEWSDAGIEGANRFLRRLWRTVYDYTSLTATVNSSIPNNTENDLTNNDNPSPEDQKLRSLLQQTILKVTNDYSVRQQFNTATASIMELLNAYNKVANNITKDLAKELLCKTLIMLSPIVPHICEELWQMLEPTSEISTQIWPKADLNAISQDEIELAIQVNGKLRATMTIAVGLSNSEIEHLAKSHPNVAKFVSAQVIKKVILVPNKLINIVI